MDELPKSHLLTAFQYRQTPFDNGATENARQCIITI
jgi:hypothetical protein